jgi:hypothetical protein
MIHRDEYSHIDRLSGDEAQIAKVLSALPRIDAAKDFDFKLKARIAQRKSAVPAKSGYIKSLAFAAPVILALIVASLFFIRQPGQSDYTGQAPQPVEVQKEETASAVPVTPTEPIATPKIEIPTTPVADRGPLTAQSRRSVETTREPGTRPNRIRGGSIDFGVEQRPTILPKGFDPNTTVKPITAPPGQTIPRTPSLSETLQSNGITAARSSGGWIISSVAAGSASDRAGVKKGDVIESGKTDANGTRLTVKRAGSRLEINIKP